MVTALGVAQDTDGQGMDALTHRRILAARWENLGVMSGLEVSGAAPLRYRAEAGVAVCSTGSADGTVEAYWPGGITEEQVEAGDGAYGRIDSVYLMAPTVAGGQVTLHVAQGIPSAAPRPSTLPAGGLRVRDMLMPAGASATQSASPVGSVDYAIPYAASLGLLDSRMDDRPNIWADETPRKFTAGYHMEVHLPTDRLLELTYDADVSCEGDPGWLSWGSGFILDDEDVPHSGRETLHRDGVWVHHHNSVLVEVPGGTHVVAVKHGVAGRSGNGKPLIHGGETGGLSYPGIIVRVWDRGAVR